MFDNQCLKQLNYSYTEIERNNKKKPLNATQKYFSETLMISGETRIVWLYGECTFTHFLERIHEKNQTAAARRSSNHSGWLENNAFKR
jgi:hypothetical protein